MNRLVAVLMAGVFCTTITFFAEAQNFMAGAAMVDITPRLGTTINGGFFTGYTQKIHDRVHARAIVMQKKGVTIAIVLVDVCYMENRFVNHTKKLISQSTGIPPEHLLIAATHTHSAGAVEQWGLANADMPYRNKLPSLISQAVADAKKKLRPAMAAFGSANVPEHVVCRRYYLKEGSASRNPVTGQLDKVVTNPSLSQKVVGPAAPTDPEFSYLVIKGTDGNWISVLGNYSMHYVGDVEDNTISADYFGEFSKQIKEKLKAPDDFVGLLSNGTSGDANIIDVMQPNRYPKEYYEKTRIIANDLSNKVMDGLAALQWEKNPAIDVQYADLPVAIRKPDAAAVEEAKKVVAETDYVSMPLKKFDEDQMRRFYMLEQLVVNDMPDSASVAVQALKIGNNVIGGIAGEVFSETGLYLKEKSPVRSYFTISNANGYVGYIPTEREHQLGGYETWRCRSSMLEIKGDQLIRVKLLALIKKCK